MAQRLDIDFCCMDIWLALFTCFQAVFDFNNLTSILGNPGTEARYWLLLFEYLTWTFALLSKLYWLPLFSLLSMDIITFDFHIHFDCDLHFDIDFCLTFLFVFRFVILFEFVFTFAFVFVFVFALSLLFSFVFVFAFALLFCLCLCLY